MSKCVDFAAKKAIILHQSDYSLTRLVEKEFVDLPQTKKDALHATQIAYGFGIAEKDITFIEDMPITAIHKVFNNVKREFIELSKKNRRTFLFVYAAGHGIADQEQLMVLNGTSGNLFNQTAMSRDVCRVTKNMCTVFTVNDMCKDIRERY